MRPEITRIVCVCMCLPCLFIAVVIIIKWKRKQYITEICLPATHEMCIRDRRKLITSLFYNVLTKKSKCLIYSVLNNNEVDRITSEIVNYYVVCFGTAEYVNKPLEVTDVILRQKLNAWELSNENINVRRYSEP